MCQRAPIRHFNVKAKRAGRLDISRLLLRKITLICAVALTGATLAGCTQSPVRTTRSDWSAPSRQAYLPPVRKRYPPVFATGSVPRDPTVGVASFYTEGTRTASGERLNPNELTAAHPTLPFGTRLRITTVASGRSVVVRVNDRGPFLKGRAIDVSYSAAKQLGITERGIAKVKMEVVQ
jgi:rare lipoprotein A